LFYYGHQVWIQKKIATEMRVSVKTVYNYFYNIRKSLKINKNSEILTVLGKYFININSNIILTPRGNEVFRLILAGKSDKEIAEELDISYSTERFHVYSILSKNNCKTKDDLYMLYYNDLIIKLHIVYLVKLLRKRICGL